MGRFFLFTTHFHWDYNKHLGECDREVLFFVRITDDNTINTHTNNKTISDSAEQSTFNLLLESQNMEHDNRKIRGVASMTMKKQESYTACTFGETFGFDEKKVWVDRGCRAVFVVKMNQGWLIGFIETMINSK